MKHKFSIEIFSIMLLLCLFILTSFTFLYYSYESNETNNISVEDVSLTYLESNSEINLVNALPMSDKDGKLLEKEGAKFEFAVTTNSEVTKSISYDITIESLIVETGYLGLSPEDIKVYLTDKNGKVLVKPTKISDLEDFKLYTKRHNHKEEKVSITSKYVLRAWIDKDVEATEWYKEENKQYQYKFRINIKGGETEYIEENLDKSGANIPELDTNMIPVYYDGDVWRKAQENNSNEEYQWYDYADKMWANSVTVTNASRDTYLNAKPGTEISMDDILTMQVWIPRYKYKVWNYNADGKDLSKEQEIEIVWENGTDTTGEIKCQDSISGTNNSTSEACMLKETNEICTNSVCKNKTYTHPAFTFGDDELKGFWIGKFELTGSINNITTKPDLMSIRNQKVGSFETNIMNMKSSGNKYGLSTTTDTHMIKNSEWGAVSYLSHSQYGMCINPTFSVVNYKNVYFLLKIGFSFDLMCGIIFT